LGRYRGIVSNPTTAEFAFDRSGAAGDGEVRAGGLHHREARRLEVFGHAGDGLRGGAELLVKFGRREEFAELRAAGPVE
jgi:hypothetical protein